MQHHVKMCKENNFIEDTTLTVKDAYWNNFKVKYASLKDHSDMKGRVGRHIKMIFSRMIHHIKHKGISIVVSKVLMHV